VERGWVTDWAEYHLKIGIIEIFEIEWMKEEVRITGDNLIKCEWIVIDVDGIIWKVDMKDMIIYVVSDGDCRVMEWSDIGTM